MAKELATPHELVTSFVAGLSDFLTTLVPPASRPNTFTVMMTIGTGTSVKWVADVDCTLIGIVEMANGTGVVVSRGNTQLNQLTAAGFVTKAVIMHLQNPTGAPYQINGIREKFTVGSPVWCMNGGASTVTVNLLFEA